MTVTQMDVLDQQLDLVNTVDKDAQQQLGIWRRVTDWKTAVSLGLAILVLGVSIHKGNIDLVALWHRLESTNLTLFLAAFVIFYCSFPVRGYRWKVLLQNAHQREGAEAIATMSVRGLTEIVYISFFVNCVLPAKLGDLYRAYLAKLWVRISWTRTAGTILAERIVDILILNLLLAVTGFLVFHQRMGQVSMILLLGTVLTTGGILALILMKALSHRIRPLVPARFAHRYVSFEEGTLDSFRRLPVVFGATLVIWFLEGSRLQLVFSALGLQTHISGIPFVPMLFFALASAVLTTVPFTPGGLGLVEVGLGSLMVYMGVPKADAAAVVLLDRLVSFYSIAVFGFVVYLLSKRSHFRHTV